MSALLRKIEITPHSRKVHSIRSSTISTTATADHQMNMNPALAVARALAVSSKQYLYPHLSPPPPRIRRKARPQRLSAISIGRFRSLIHSLFINGAHRFHKFGPEMQ